MIYLLLYFAAGAIVMVVPLFFQRLEEKADPLVALLGRTGWGANAKWGKTVFLEFGLPLIGNLVILVAWPVLLILKAQDSWQSRDARKQAEEAKTQKTVRPEIEPSQPRQDRKVMTDDEWAAAQIQALLAKAQGQSVTENW